MKKINKIFLDLDGVIRNWVDGIYKLFRVPPIKIHNWNGVTEYVCYYHHMTVTQFWEQQDYNFWSNLPKLSYANKVLELLPLDKVCILTSPTLSSAGGTQKWIRNNLPTFFKNKQYLIGPAKQFCASENSILIDDSDYHIDNFINAGGNGILFPQRWNKNRKYITHLDSRVDYLKNQLTLYDIGKDKC